MTEITLTFHLPKNANFFSGLQSYSGLLWMTQLMLGFRVRLIIPSPVPMATLFHKGQMVIGQVGKYKIVKHLQNTVWLARYWLLYVFMMEAILTRNHAEISFTKMLS